MPRHDEPNWEDVRWDQRAAEEAAGMLRRAAAEVEQLLAQETRHAEAVLAEWRGAARLRFEQGQAALRYELHALAAVCRGAAEQIGRASEQARTEQRRREREREEWERRRRL